MRISDVADRDWEKYLVPRDISVGQFHCVIRKQLKIGYEQAFAIYVSSNNVLPAQSEVMSTLYEIHVDSEDGFLYAQFLFEQDATGALTAAGARP